MNISYKLSDYNINDLTIKAKNGCLHSMYILGNKYLFGSEVEKNQEQCFYWLNKSHELGNIDSTRALAQLYFDGNVLEKDCSKAMSLLKKAISKEDIKSKHLMGTLYIYGLHVTKDHHKAYKLMKSAYKGGHLLSGFLVSDLFSRENKGTVKYLLKYLIMFPVSIKFIFYALKGNAGNNDRLWNLNVYQDAKWYSNLKHFKNEKEPEAL